MVRAEATVNQPSPRGAVVVRHPRTGLDNKEPPGPGPSGRIAPQLAVVVCSYGHAVGADATSSRAIRAHDASAGRTASLGLVWSVRRDCPYRSRHSDVDP